jgi:hypothetical protein
MGDSRTIFKTELKYNLIPDPDQTKQNGEQLVRNSRLGSSTNWSLILTKPSKIEDSRKDIQDWTQVQTTDQTKQNGEQQEEYASIGSKTNWSLPGQTKQNKGIAGRISKTGLKNKPSMVQATPNRMRE